VRKAKTVDFVFRDFLSKRLQGTPCGAGLIHILC
jgi:hypothetical protein